MLFPRKKFEAIHIRESTTKLTEVPSKKYLENRTPVKIDTVKLVDLFEFLNCGKMCLNDENAILVHVQYVREFDFLTVFYVGNSF